jgi:hypothetical protein
MYDVTIGVPQSATSPQGDKEGGGFPASENRRYYQKGRSSCTERLSFRLGSRVLGY